MALFGVALSAEMCEDYTTLSSFSLNCVCFRVKLNGSHRDDRHQLQRSNTQHRLHVTRWRQRLQHGHTGPHVSLGRPLPRTPVPSTSRQLGPSAGTRSVRWRHGVEPEPAVSPPAEASADRPRPIPHAACHIRRDRRGNNC